MKIVRLENNVVKEILPEATYEKGIVFWYGENFAAKCVEAPDDVTQGMRLVDGQWLPIEQPPELTPAQQRENAYANDRIVEWQEELITVDEANDLFIKYFAEDSANADILRALIIVAKSNIRENYPDL